MIFGTVPHKLGHVIKKWGGVSSDEFLLTVILLFHTSIINEIHFDNLIDLPNNLVYLFDLVEKYWYIHLYICKEYEKNHY